MENKLTEDKNGEADAIQLLASIMICYPRISKVGYEGKARELLMAIGMKLPENEEAYLEGRRKLLEGLAFFQELEGLIDARTDVNYRDCTLQIKRDIDTLSRREIDLLLVLVNDYFAEWLLPEDSKQPDEIVAAAQLEMLDARIQMTAQMDAPISFVGIREGIRVMVYDRLAAKV